MSRALWANLILLGTLILALICPGPAAEVRPAAPPAYYAGWAMEAYPEQPAADMEAMVRRTVAAGANVVWIGHNNPGEVDAGKVEPGLSYAVYEATLDPADPRHEAAVAMVAAQHRMLAACRAVSVKAVLPVGYQIQMGRTWNERHPEAIRRDAHGRPLDIFGGGVSASFYAPTYRRDIEAYYRWVDAEFVRPYADVLLMLNLADEPIGGDYSAAAEAEFRRRYGWDFAEVGDEPQRQRRLGEFQSRIVAEYAAWSARLWQAIDPDMPVTMSFDGAQARLGYVLPDVEALFRDTPSNFVVTFDAYPRDGLPNVALSDADLTGLFLLARSVGLYSARYHKPVWLWAAANRWGLSGSSPDPGTVSDAVANGLSLALLVRQGGGDLRGIAYWNYNVKEQGLYNDTLPIAYDVETMFARVSAGLPLLRRLMAAPAGRPNVLILAPPAVAYQQIGAAREAVRLNGLPFPHLSILAGQNVNAAVVPTLQGWLGILPAGQGWPLDGVRAIAVIAPGSEYLPAADLASLRLFLASGGRLVTSQGVAAALSAPPRSGMPGQPHAGGEPDEIFGDLAVRYGSLYVARQGVPTLFEQDRTAALGGFWQQVLGLDTVQPGYRIVSGRYALAYHRGPEPASLALDLPFQAAGYRYDAQAEALAWHPAASDGVERLQGSAIRITLERREYAWLAAVSRPRPRRR